MTSVKEKILEALERWDDEYRYSSPKGNKIEKYLATSSDWKQEKSGRAVFLRQVDPDYTLRITLTFSEVIVEEMRKGHNRWGVRFKAPIKGLKVDSKGFSHKSDRFNYS